MKKLPLKSDQYQRLAAHYKAWLQTLGYAQTTVESLPIYIRELLHYLEQQGKQAIQQTTAQDIKDFYFQWKKRSNQTTGAGLSNSHINKGILAYNKFIRFLSVTGIHHLELSLPREQNKTHPRTVLTKSEIKALYSAIETYPDKRHLTTPYRLRDRAILAIFYSCGLRSNEGSNLDVSDILTDRRLIIVRKGKGNKERYVPITPGNLQDIENYITRGRSWFLVPREKQNHINNQALLINEKGSRLTSSGIYIRIKYLQEQSGVDKQIGIHTLRHSIATHLLQSGMEIEPISKFLGHSTLASTQIYTHLSAEVEDQGGYCQ